LNEDDRVVSVARTDANDEPSDDDDTYVADAPDTAPDTAPEND
jgi:hypothetical protein